MAESVMSSSVFFETTVQEYQWKIQSNKQILGKSKNTVYKYTGVGQ